jgi:hypothetical protein
MFFLRYVNNVRSKIDVLDLICTSCVLRRHDVHELFSLVTYAYLFYAMSLSEEEKTRTLATLLLDILNLNAQCCTFDILIEAVLWWRVFFFFYISRIRLVLLGYTPSGGPSTRPT